MSHKVSVVELISVSYGDHRQCDKKGGEQIRVERKKKEKEKRKGKRIKEIRKIRLSTGNGGGGERMRRDEN
jgi:hypothetical protein